MSQIEKAADLLKDFKGSPLPWSYHNPRLDGKTAVVGDWIEDAIGNRVTENIGYLDATLIVACVNAAHQAMEESRG